MATLKIKDSNQIYRDLSLNGYSLKSLSKKVDVTEQYLSSVFKGKRSPSPLLAKRISNELNKEIRDYFFAEESCKS